MKITTLFSVTTTFLLHWKTAATSLTVDWVYGGEYNEPIVLNTGDSIEFVNVGYHDLVIMENEQKFEACDFSGGATLAPQVYTNSGVAEVVYFGCSFGQHCDREYGNMVQEVIFTAPAPTLTVDWVYGGDYSEPIVLNTGDSIEFVNVGYHDLVIMENEQKFEACDFSGGATLAPQVYINSGVAEVVYFGCSIGQHCDREYGNMVQEVIFTAPCVEDSDTEIVGLLTATKDVFATCSQLASAPQYIDQVCSLDPYAVAESLSPAIQCPYTCGNPMAMEDPSSKIIALVLVGTDVKRATCGALATLNQSTIEIACNLDLTIWNDLTASNVCCDTCT